MLPKTVSSITALMTLDLAVWGNIQQCYFNLKVHTPVDTYLCLMNKACAGKQ